MTRSRSVRFTLRTAAPLALAVTLWACGATSSSPSPVDATASGGGTTATVGSSSTGCAATVTGLPISVSASSGRYPITIGVGTGCTWTVQTDASWTDVMPASGSGSGTSTLTVQENTRTDNRTATVTVNGQAFRVLQQSICTYAVTPTSLDLGAAGGGVSLSLSTPSGCAWTASATESWIRTVTPSGSGPAAVQFDVSANANGQRHATITVAGIHVAVTQQPQ